jgi:hypothetical protein
MSLERMDPSGSSRYDARKPFEERFERMVQWQARREPNASRADLEAKTLRYMGTMPAWKEHPRVRAAAG